MTKLKTKQTTDIIKKYVKKLKKMALKNCNGVNDNCMPV
jgi:hypothetical protein